MDGTLLFTEEILVYFSLPHTPLHPQSLRSPVPTAYTQGLAHFISQMATLKLVLVRKKSKEVTLPLWTSLGTLMTKPLADNCVMALIPVFVKSG
jgi:hypothetical protein